MEWISTFLTMLVTKQNVDGIICCQHRLRKVDPRQLTRHLNKNIQAVFSSFTENSKWNSMKLVAIPLKLKTICLLQVQLSREAQLH